MTNAARAPTPHLLWWHQVFCWTGLAILPFTLLLQWGIATATLTGVPIEPEPQRGYDSASAWIVAVAGAAGLLVMARVGLPGRVNVLFVLAFLASIVAAGAYDFERSRYYAGPIVGLASALLALVGAVLGYRFSRSRA